MVDQVQKDLENGDYRSVLNSAVLHISRALADPETPRYALPDLLRNQRYAIEQLQKERDFHNKSSRPVDEAPASTRRPARRAVSALTEAPEATEDTPGALPQPLSHVEPSRRPARRVNRVARRSIGGEGRGAE